MGETIKAVANTLGLSAYIMGILVNLNNMIAILMGLAGFAWGVFKSLDMREDWLKKRHERMQRNRSDKKSSVDENPS